MTILANEYVRAGLKNQKAKIDKVNAKNNQ